MSLAVIYFIILLIFSNMFMTFAWYGHLKNMSSKPWYFAVFFSWGIAFFEYILMVPANRIGHSELTLPQLKILQEVITLVIFIPFSIYYMGEPIKINYLYACFCMLGAVYFIFN